MSFKNLRSIKLDHLIFLVVFILSGCSTLEQSSNIYKDSIISFTLKDISNCTTPEELKDYFDSINYKILSKTNHLIIPKIGNNLFLTEDNNLKKEVFFKSMYPIAHKVNEEIKKDRKALLSGQNLKKLKEKYKTKDIEELKVRIDTIPTEIIMAQAAIESAYGTSRFAIEGNALFGQWTQNETGMIPNKNPQSKWKVARFDSPLESAKKYALNINTNNAYKNFRDLRYKNLDPIYGLDKYSQKGCEYINIVKSVINKNNLKQYR